jgi:hypothetical protein
MEVHYVTEEGLMDHESRSSATAKEQNGASFCSMLGCKGLKFSGADCREKEIEKDFLTVRDLSCQT